MTGKTEIQNKRPRFSVIDLIIVILFVTCLAGVVIRFYLSHQVNEASKLQEAEISFLVDNISVESADALKIGDTIYLNGDKAGTLKSKEASEAVFYYENNSGVPVAGFNELKRDVRGVISVSGSMTDEGFMLNGNTYVAAGKQIYVETLNLHFTLLVTGVEIIQ